MGEIVKKLDCSTATVQAKIHSHNAGIERMGYCAECRRMKGTHEMTKTSG